MALLLAHVPVQTLSQAFEPVVHRVAETDGWDREARSGDGDAGERERDTSQILNMQPNFNGHLKKLVQDVNFCLFVVAR